MTRYKFGEAIEDGDILELQGVEYHLVPLGMRAMRKMLTLRENTTSSDPEAQALAQIEAGIDFVTNSVIPEEREALREPIEDRVSPQLLAAMADVLWP